MFWFWIIAIALLALSNLFWIGMWLSTFRKWNRTAIENDELRQFNMQQVTEQAEAAFDHVMLGLGFKRRDGELWPEEISEK